MKLKQICSFLLVVSVLLSLCACGSSSLACKHCGEEYEEGDLYCPSCGEKIQTSTLCSKGHENPPEAKFCGQCGEALGSSDPDGDNNTNSDDSGSDTSDDASSGEPNDIIDPNDPAANIWLKVKSTESDVYHYEYYYDYDGTLVAECTMYYGLCVGIRNYSYDSHGTVSKIESSGVDYTGTPPSIVIKGERSTRYYDFYNNTYDENGKLIYQEETSSSTSSSMIQNGNAWEYKYDESGELIESIEYAAVSNGSARVANYKTEYENGKKTKFFGMTDDGWELYNEFFYNEKGHLISIDNTLLDIDEHGNLLVDDRGSSTIRHQYISLAEYRAKGLHNKRPKLEAATQTGDASGGNSVNGVKCEWCTGGRYECHGCDGKGMVPTGFDNPKHRLCAVCHGECTLVCAHCGGDGIFGN